MKAIDKIGSAFLRRILRRILRRMKELGVSQTELAKRMKVSRPYITKVLHQDVNITFRTAAKLAGALKMDFFPELRPHESPELTQKLPNMVQYAHKHEQCKAHGNRGESAAGEVFGCIPHGARAYLVVSC